MKKHSALELQKPEKPLSEKIGDRQLECPASITPAVYDFHTRLG
jgi:hypothetical protein